MKSYTFASAFEIKILREHKKKEFFEKLKYSRYK